ncbi:MAG TPA: S53 family peptidase [Caldimonas sp.]|jgi:kumamolisin
MATKIANRHTLPGTTRRAIPGARAAVPVLPEERIEVSVRLRAKPGARDLDAGGALGDQPPAERSYLSRDEFAARHGASAADIGKVAAFAKAHQLAVVESSVPRRTVVLSGTAAAMSQAFGVTLKQFEHDGGTYRGRIGAISVPGELADIVEGVFGLDNRPQASPHFQVLGAPGVVVARAPGASFTPPQLARLYDFPTGVDGSGQCIAIVELGGGFRPADISAYFKGLKLPVPAVKAISVDGGRNQPSNANSADGEVMLDIEVAAAIAPKAKIAVYFAPNTNQGFLDAITTAVHDTVNKPSVISISWGSAEANWTPQAMTQFDQAFQAAAAMGVTVCCAAGDNGSADGVGDGKPHVDFPASSPFALGCGGTRISASGDAISDEVVWNENAKTSATGGGVSGFFAVPAYQKSAKVPPIAGGKKTGRGVPDVAGDADPNSGYRVRVDGQSMVIGGTSAVAPLWAGLIALLNQKLGKPVGYLNPLLYGSLMGRGAFRDVVSGGNGSYAARPGWDACTGWGSPIGSKLLAGLGARPTKKPGKKKAGAASAAQGRR